MLSAATSGSMVSDPPAALTASQWWTAASWTWWRVMKAVSCCQPAHVQHGALWSASRSTSTSLTAPALNMSTSPASSGLGGRRPWSGGALSCSAAIVDQNQCTSVRCHTRSATDQSGQCSTRASRLSRVASAKPALCSVMAAMQSNVESVIPGNLDSDTDITRPNSVGFLGAVDALQAV